MSFFPGPISWHFIILCILEQLKLYIIMLLVEQYLTATIVFLFNAYCMCISNLNLHCDRISSYIGSFCTTIATNHSSTLHSLQMFMKVL